MAIPGVPALYRAAVGSQGPAQDIELRSDAEDGASGAILGGGIKARSTADIDGEVGAGAQRNGLHSSATGVGTAFAETTGEGDDEGDDQGKKKAGTATMHEPSSRPFARREHNNVVGRKTVSVEGHWDFEQAAKFR